MSLEMVVSFVVSSSPCSVSAGLSVQGVTTDSKNEKMTIALAEDMSETDVTGNGFFFRCLF